MSGGTLSPTYAASRLFHVGPHRIGSAAYVLRTRTVTPHVEHDRVGRPTPHTLACGGGGVFVVCLSAEASPSESQDGSRRTSVSSAFNGTNSLLDKSPPRTGVATCR